MYMHPAMSRDLIAARVDDNLRRASDRRPARANRRSLPARRSARDRASPRLRWRILRLS